MYGKVKEYGNKNIIIVAFLRQYECSRTAFVILFYSLYLVILVIGRIGAYSQTIFSGTEFKKCVDIVRINITIIICVYVWINHSKSGNINNIISFSPVQDTGFNISFSSRC